MEIRNIVCNVSRISDGKRTDAPQLAVGSYDIDVRLFPSIPQQGAC